MTAVFLDACVLYPPLVRRIVLDLALAGGFAPLWSDRVLEEWRLSVVRKQGLDEEARVLAARDAMAAFFPGALVPRSAALEAEITLPDPADAHVLACAVSAEATILLTYNLRDFPKRTLARYGIEAVHPDSYLWLALCEDPVRMTSVMDAITTDFDLGDAHAVRRTLKKAQLPRFAKAYAVSE